VQNGSPDVSKNRKENAIAFDYNEETFQNTKDCSKEY
jgi:hypothetical protein